MNEMGLLNSGLYSGVVLKRGFTVYEFEQEVSVYGSILEG